MKNSLPSVIVEFIPSIHAFLGCDAISREYSIGKGKESLKKILGTEKMQACLREFNKKDAENASVERNGEELLSQFYESTTELSFKSLRCRIFHKKVVTATNAITPETLPLTSNAAMFHSYRTYYQVWRSSGSIDPLGWGFSIQKDRMMPVNMTETTALPNLHKMVHCSCRTAIIFVIF